MVAVIETGARVLTLYRAASSSMVNALLREALEYLITTITCDKTDKETTANCLINQTSMHLLETIETGPIWIGFLQTTGSPPNSNGFRFGNVFVKASSFTLI